MNTSSSPSITGLILAGGQSRRMAGEDKGLILFKNKPLIHYSIKRLDPQVDQLIINANRHLDDYKAFGYDVIVDSLTGFCGPLAGMLSAMQSVDTDYILTVPCDSPTISLQLRQRMMETLLLEKADLAVAYDGERLQPVFSLLPCRLHKDLERYLADGGRKIDLWLSRFKMAVVDFSDQKDCFLNFNRPDEIKQHQKSIRSPIPILGFSAFSGTGKTTLLRRLIPLLTAQGITTGVIKHAHHSFDIDVPGKDSYEIRQAGAGQVLIASSQLMALMEVQDTNQSDPLLADLIPRLNTSNLDLILVEGFKHELLPKIELYRPSLAKPLLYPNDDNIIAIASDTPLVDTPTIPQIDLNDTHSIATFIQNFIANWAP